MIQPTVKKYVFISSPYTNGCQAANVREQHEAFDLLLRLGHFPFAPLMSHYHQIIFPVTYERWIAWDLAWIERCDCVLRLPGESPGADRECAHTEENGIPVIRTEEEFRRVLMPVTPELNGRDADNLEYFLKNLD